MDLINARNLRNLREYNVKLSNRKDHDYLPGPTIQPAKVWSMSHRKNPPRAFFNPSWISPKESSLQDEAASGKRGTPKERP